MTEQTEPIELTVTQTALRLKKVAKTIHNMIADGRLKARWVPAPVPYYLVSVESIEACEASQQEKERDQSGN